MKNAVLLNCLKIFEKFDNKVLTYMFYGVIVSLAVEKSNAVRGNAGIGRQA